MTDAAPAEAWTLVELANDGGGDALEERLRALEQANDLLRAEKLAAEQLAAARARWLAHVSHELRTPMNGIIGMTELTLETDLTDEQRDHLDLVRRSADSLLTLVNDILDHSKITSHKLAIEEIPFSVRDVVTDVVKALQAGERREHAVRLVADIDTAVPNQVTGDPGRIRQVIVNLVGNAMKFTEEGQVTVALTSRMQADENQLHFRVADTGIGIHAERMAGIFEPFEQAGSGTARQFGGTGLGLAISRQLIELMGGEIRVESEVGVGTIFDFTVRVGRSTPVASPVGRVDLSEKRVLVLSDTPVNQDMLLEVLEEERIGAMVIGNVAETIAYLDKAQRAERPIDVVILDLQRDGLATAETVASEARGAHLILMTPTGQRGDAARCRELGLSAFLTGTTHAGDLTMAMRAVVSGADDLITRHWLRERRRSLRVLLADDSRTNRLITTRILERNGHLVVAAANGLEAMRAFERDVFDVVVLDVEMPEMDGPTAARAMRATGTPIPIVALTGHVGAEDAESFRAAGFVEVANKPVQADELMELLARVTAAAGQPRR